MIHLPCASFSPVCLFLLTISRGRPSWQFREILPGGPEKHHLPERKTIDPTATIHRAAMGMAHSTPRARVRLICFIHALWNRCNCLVALPARGGGGGGGGGGDFSNSFPMNALVFISNSQKVLPT